MEIYRKKLENGTDISFYHTDIFKSALFDLSFVFPLEKISAAHYALLANVLTRPTEKHPTLQSLSVLKDELYALSVSVDTLRKGELLLLSFRVNATSDSYAFDGEKILEGAFSLVSEMIFEPKKENGAFPENEVAEQKKLLINDIESLIEDKPSFAMKRARELLCEGEPFALSAAGDIETVKSITPQTLYHYYEKMLIGAPVFFAYAGDAERELVLALTEKYFRFSKRKSDIPLPTKHIRKGKLCRISEKNETMEQSIVTIGFVNKMPENAGERAVLSVFDEIFGGISGRLFMNVREKEGLCYYCSSHVSGRKNVAFVQCGLEPGTEERAINAIYRELEAMKNGDFSDSDIENAKKAIISSLNSAGGNLYSAINFMLGQSLLGSGGRDIRSNAELVRAVTREDIAKCAKSFVPELEYILGGEA